MSMRQDYAAQIIERYARIAEATAPSDRRETLDVKVSADVARTHPLYGVAGWTVVLAVFTILDAIIAALVMLGTIVVASRGIAAWHWLIVLVQGAMLTWLVVCIVKLFEKHEIFPRLFTCMCVASGALSVFMMVVGGFNWVALVQLAVVGIYIGYVQSSRRINVTYRHLVAADDPILAQSGAGNAPEAAPAA